MTGFESKRQMAKAKLDDEADTLLIVYQRGFADGKRAAQPEQEPVAQITPPGPITQYRIPTQRPWVGLTDEDRRKFAAAQYGWEDLLIAAEAKLKERNGY